MVYDCEKTEGHNEIANVFWCVYYYGGLKYELTGGQYFISIVKITQTKTI